MKKITQFETSLAYCEICDNESDIHSEEIDSNELKLTQLTLNDLKNETEITNIKSKSCSCPCGACGAPFEEVTWNLD